MNERLRDLVRQAGLDDPDFPIEDWDNVPLAKFAELIVRECISALEEKIYRSIDHEGDEIWIDLILKEHFGVEE